MKNASRDTSFLEMIRSIKIPEKFSKASKNIDRMLKNFSIEKIKEKLSNPIKLSFSGKFATRDHQDSSNKE